MHVHGCVPSKTLIEAAVRRAGFAEAMAAVRETVTTIAAAETSDVLTRHGIDVLRGHAEFVSPRQMTVDGRKLRARGFVLATGSRPAIPPVPGLADVPYLTNDQPAAPPRREAAGSSRPHRVTWPAVRGYRCHGHRPLISTSSEKLKKVRIATIAASIATLVRVGEVATVRTMSPATSSSRPRRMV